MTPEEIAALPPVKPEPVRTCVSAVCLLSRRMLGSLDRRSLLESVQTVRGRYMHVRTGNARPQPAVPTGAGLNRLETRVRAVSHFFLTCINIDLSPRH